MSKLASYAVQESNSRGRAHKETAPKDGRSEFARDRDRVMHSEAFRRLNGKTQVFTHASDVYGTASALIAYNDKMRTRLTHSLEVAQVSRSIARALNLNEDLVETLALAHDLGHAPFGHTGQDELNLCMQPYGGFEHNIQSLRTVDVLETRYIEFQGLNLCFETKEGILKHCSPKNAQLLGDVAERHRLKKSPTLEAQATDLGDAIAYACHDVDDGISSGLIGPEDLMPVEIFATCWNDVSTRFPNAPKNLKVQETIRDMMGLLVRGVIVQSRDNIEKHNIKTLDDVRNAPELIALPQGLAEQHKKLKSHMYKVLYHNPEVGLVRKDAKHVIETLFNAYINDINLIPEVARRGVTTESDINDKARTVADYVAGMTDSYAYRQSALLQTHTQSLDILS